MASTKEYLDFVMEQLSGLDEISSRAMMGEYILYYRERFLGAIMVGIRFFGGSVILAFKK